MLLIDGADPPAAQPSREHLAPGNKTVGIPFLLWYSLQKEQMAKGHNFTAGSLKQFAWAKQHLHVSAGVCDTAPRQNHQKHFYSFSEKEVFPVFTPEHYLKEKKQNMATSPSCALLKEAAGRYKHTQGLIMTHL